MKRVVPGGLLVMLLPLLFAGGVPREGGEALQTRHTVEMRNFAFAPARLEAAVGDTVVWINRDAAPHTATDSAAGWNSGEVAAGARWVMVVSEPGRTAYVCEYHPTMRGELVVHASNRIPTERRSRNERP